MKITEVRIRRTYKDHGALLARLSITLDGEYAIHDVKVLQGPHGRIVAMPSRSDDEYLRIYGEVPPSGGKYRFHDIVHPTTPEARKNLEAAVLNAYYAHMALPEEQQQFIEGV